MITQQQQNPFGRKRDELPGVEELLASLQASAADLPWSDEHERGTLSCIFQIPEKLFETSGRVKTEDFYHEPNRTVYREMITMHGEGVPIDPVIITTRLRNQGLLDGIGGPAFITDLFSFVPLPTHFRYYLNRVADDAKLRREVHAHLLAVSSCLRHYKTGVERPVENTLSECDNIVTVMREGHKVDSKTSATLKQCLSEHVDHMERVQDAKDNGRESLIATGFPTIDAQSGGISLGETWLITGPTKGGKSILCGNIAKHAATRGTFTKIYTNEVQRVAYTGRLLASESEHFDGSIERKGFSNRRQMEEYSKASRILSQNIGDRIILDNAQGKYVEDMIADIRQEARKGVTLFVVDLIGKVQTRRQFGVREQELAFVSNRLSDAAATLNVGMIIVSQENEMGAVRESRSLAFDCSAWLQLQYVTKARAKKVGMFKNDEAEQPEVDRSRRNLHIKLARGFESGTVIPCYCDGARFLIGEIDNRHEHTHSHA